MKATEVLWIPQKDANTKNSCPNCSGRSPLGWGGWACLSLKPQCAQLISSDRKHHSLLPALHKISQLKVSADRTQNGESNRGFVDTSKGCQHQKLMSKLLWPFPSPVIESFDYVNSKNKERSMGAASCRDLTRCLAKSERLCIKVWAATS